MHETLEPLPGTDSQISDRARHAVCAVSSVAWLDYLIHGHPKNLGDSPQGIDPGISFWVVFQIAKRGHANARAPRNVFLLHPQSEPCFFQSC